MLASTTTTLLGLLAVVVLTLGTGYFVAAEFAFVAAKRGKLQDLADTGDRRAEQAVQVHRRLSFMLSGAQVGITVTSLVVGYIAEPTLGTALRPLTRAVGLPDEAAKTVAIALAFLLATILQMVIGELAPKNLAIARPEPVARRLAGSLLVFMRVTAPIVRWFDGAANRLLRRVGIEPVEELHGGVSIEELDVIIDASVETGKLTAGQASLIERAIEFRSLQVSSVMQPWNRVVTIDHTASAEDLRALLTTRHSRFPVVDDDDTVVGVVTAKSLFALKPGELSLTPIIELMHQPLPVPETAGLRTVLADLRAEPAELAIVVDEYGGPAGVVTLEDLVEELVGAAGDDHDALPSTIEALPDGRWTVPGRTRLDEIERHIGVDLPTDGAYDTIAGLVLMRLGRMPSGGEIVEVVGHQIEVVAMRGWAVETVAITPASDHEDEDEDET